MHVCHRQGQFDMKKAIYNVIYFIMKMYCKNTVSNLKHPRENQYCDKFASKR